MTHWLQHLLVLFAVIACAAFIFRGAFRALKGHKSKLGGCGVCSGCATTQPDAKPQANRISMIPMDALQRSAKKSLSINTAQRSTQSRRTKNSSSLS